MTQSRPWKSNKLFGYKHKLVISIAKALESLRQNDWIGRETDSMTIKNHDERDEQ